MRLGIDAREIQDGVFTGIGRPLANFIGYFARQVNDDSCVLFSARKLPMEWGARVKNVVMQERQTQVWDQIQLVAAIHRERIELFYSPYYKLPLLAACPCVCAVFDLMYLIVPEYRYRLNYFARSYYKTWGIAYLRKAKRIFTCSEFSKTDIEKIYGIQGGKIDVIPLSVARIYHPEKDPGKIQTMKVKYGIDESYLLYMGNFKPHKNVKNILLAFQKIHFEFPKLKLVLAGSKEHLYPELVKLTKMLVLTDQVIFTGKITEKDEPHLLYSGAEVFLMPSYYEGFGLPPAEAMACGTPVVASNTTSVPEVVRDAGILIDPNNVEAIIQAAVQILKDKSLKAALITRGFEYVKDYEEERIARKMYACFLRVLSH